MYFFVMAAAAFLVGILVNTSLRNIVNELENDASSMDSTQNTFLRQMKSKYKNYLKIGHEIHNTEAFAGKYLNKYKKHGLSLRAYEKLSSFCSGVCVICGGLGALTDKSHAMEYLLIGFLAMYILLGSRRMIDVPGKKKQITVNIVDYFENHLLAATLEAESEQTQKDLYKSDMDYERKSETYFTEEMPKDRFMGLSDEEKRVIDEILQEYLG